MGHSSLDNDVAIGIHSASAGGVAGQLNGVPSMGVSGEVGLVADLLPLLRAVLSGDDYPSVEGVLRRRVSRAGVPVADKVDGVDISVSDLGERSYNLELVEQHVLLVVTGYDLVEPLLVNVQAVPVLVKAAVALELNLKAVRAGDETAVIAIRLNAYLIDAVVAQLGLRYLNGVSGSDDGGVVVSYLRETVNSLLSLVERLVSGALGVGRLVVGGVGTSLRPVSGSLSVSGVVERLSRGALGSGGVLVSLVS